MSPSFPSEQVRDLADIGPDSLWAVWSQMPTFLKQSCPHLDPVLFHWVLASPGEEGLVEISKGYPTSLIAAVPLSTLRQAAQVFGVEDVGPTPGWVRAAFGLTSKKRFVLIKDAYGNSRVGLNQRLLAGEREVLRGDMRDFISTLGKGNKILANRVWTEVFDDVRSFAQGGHLKWLFHQQHPRAAASAERLFLNED